jgi:hypothetical protein
MKKGGVVEVRRTWGNQKCRQSWFISIKSLIGRPMHRCEDNIKMGLDAVMCQSEVCACSDKCSVFIEAGKFLITWVTLWCRNFFFNFSTPVYKM